MQSVFYIRSSIRNTSIYRPWYKELSSGTKTGSGVYIKHGGKPFILTCYHVIDNATNIFVVIDQRKFAAEVCFVFPETDLAMLTADGEAFKGRKPVEIGNTPQAGSMTTIIGFPGYSLNINVTKHIVGRLVLTDYYNDCIALAIQVDGAVNPGNSGGPALNDAGQIIGIVHGSAIEFDNMHMMIPSLLIKFMLESFDRGKLQVYTKNVHMQLQLTEIHKKLIGAGELSGVLVHGGSKNLKDRDFLYRIGNYDVSDFGEISAKILKDIYESGAPESLLDTSHIPIECIWSIIPDDIEYTFYVLREGKKKSFVDSTVKYRNLIRYFPEKGYEYVQIGPMTFTVPYSSYTEFDSSSKVLQLARNVVIKYYGVPISIPDEELVVMSFSAEHMPHPYMLLGSLNGIRIRNLRHLYEVYTRERTKDSLSFDFTYPRYQILTTESELQDQKIDVPDHVFY